jgi:hypothetical protein
VEGESIILERTWPPPADPYASPNRLGGRPNLPPDVDWPRIRFADGATASLDFLAQVDLASLPAVRGRDVLPATGTLFFFALSQSHLPFEELGDDAFRVVYVAGDTRGVALRDIPSDAGWNQDEPDHTRTIATMVRNTDGPRGDLHPVCAVRPMTVDAVERVYAGARPAPDPLFFYRLGQPIRVEDALLLINVARNNWFENIVPLATIVERQRHAARSSLAFTAKRYPGIAVTPEAWIETVLSDDGVRGFEIRYDAWRTQATQLWHDLAARGRTTTLDSAERADVLTMFEDASKLWQAIRPNGLRLSSVVAVSLTTLLAHDPGFAADIPAEIEAAHPLPAGLATKHAHPHRMLGRGHSVQHGTMTGPDPVLLLQLEADECGPRFDWWDAGNLTFWISESDLIARRFDLARAEIEGH